MKTKTKTIADPAPAAEAPPWLRRNATDAMGRAAWLVEKLAEVRLQIARDATGDLGSGLPDELYADAFREALDAAGSLGGRVDPIEVATLAAWLGAMRPGLIAARREARERIESERAAEAERVERERREAEERARREEIAGRSEWERAEQDRATAEAEKWLAYEAEQDAYRAWKAANPGPATASA